MAKVWLCREGDKPTLGGPAYSLSLDECIEKLKLSESRFLCEPSTTPRFGDLGDQLGAVRGYQYVVVEIGQDEIQGKHSKWRPGFYLSPLSPGEAIEHLGPPRLPWA